MNLNDLFNEEKVRLDPKCWTGKKIGNPKTKVKGGVRVNNCVPAESVAEANDPNFVGFMNNTLGDRVDAKPEQPKTGHDWYDNAPTMSMDNMPSYKHAFKFGMSVLQSMDAETKQHFAEADNDELFSYLMKLARKKGFEPKYFVEEDMFEVTGLFSEIFHDPSMQDWEWADLLRSTLNNQGVAEGSELKQAKRKYNQAAKDANADQVGAGKKIDAMKNSLRQRDIEKKKDVAEGLDKPEEKSMYDYHGVPGLDKPEEKSMYDYRGVPGLDEQGMAEGEQQKGANYRDPKEAEYGPEYDDMVARVKKLAGLGPMKTVYDPNKRVYRNIPTAVQPKK